MRISDCQLNRLLFLPGQEGEGMYTAENKEDSPIRNRRHLVIDSDEESFIDDRDLPDLLEDSDDDDDEEDIQWMGAEIERRLLDNADDVLDEFNLSFLVCVKVRHITMTVVHETVSLMFHL